MVNRRRDSLVSKCAELIREVWDEIRMSPAFIGADTELTITQRKALTILSRGRLRMGDIAYTLGLSLSSATHIIDRLVDKGLVQRSEDASDRRVVLCFLSEDGRQMVEDRAAFDTAELRAVAELLDLEELDKVICSMAALNRVLKNRDWKKNVGFESAGRRRHENEKSANPVPKIVSSRQR